MKKINYAVLVLILSATLISAQTRLALGVNGSYLSPSGDFGDVYKSGIGGSAMLGFDLTSNLQLSATVGYSQFNFDNDKYNQLLNSFFGAFGTSVNVEVDSKLKIIPLMLGAKYFLINTAFKPYAAFDLGLNIISASASTVKVNGQSLTAVSDQSKTAVGWGLGAGFLLKVAPRLNLDVNAKINGNNLEVGTNMSSSTSGSSTSQSSNSTVTFISVSAGLMLEL